MYPMLSNYNGLIDEEIDVDQPRVFVKDLQEVLQMKISLCPPMQFRKMLVSLEIMLSLVYIPRLALQNFLIIGLSLGDLLNLLNCLL